MAKLNTKDIKGAGEGGVSKTLKPGNHKCKLNSISLEEFKFKPGSYHIVLNLEGPDLGKDFEGFFINKDNESLGRHKGQVGKVKASEWAYADGETKTGVKIERDAEILKFLKSYCMALGCHEWLVDQDDKHETIESLFLAFDQEKPYKDKVIDYCICGKEYTNKGGYSDFELFLPKYNKTGAPFGTSKVQVFNETDHVKKKKAEPVNEFGGEDNSLSTSASSDFALD